MHRKILACIAMMIVSTSTTSPGQPTLPFHLTSPAFEYGGPIPARYTCDGENISPALMWTDTPPETASFAIIMDDPDAPDPRAPRVRWVHWVVYNLPSGITSLPENMTAASLPTGGQMGINDSRHAAYDGPCPPVGRHRYFYKLYALDTTLPDLHQPTKPRLESAMKGHIIAEAMLMGTYRKR